MNKYQYIIGRINYISFLVVVFLLPFPQIALRYACVFWIATWLFEGRWLKVSHIKEQITNSKFILPFILFALWYAWRLLSGLWAADHEAWSLQMERYITFGALVPVGLWGLNEHYNWRQIGKVLVGSCLIAVFFYPAFLTLLLYHREIIDNHPCLHALWDYSTSEWLHFFTTNLSHLKQRMSLCCIELMGAIIAFSVYRDRWRILLPIELLLLSFVAMSGSRQAMLISICLSVCMVLILLPKVYRRLYGAVIITAGILIGGVLLVMHPRMQRTYWENPETLLEIDETHDPRTNIWLLALESPQAYTAYGLGAGQSFNYLISKYEAHHLDYYVQARYHCHNQYLEEWIELGIGGLLLFLIAWCSIIICAHGEGRQTAWLFCLMMMMAMLTECIFAVFCRVALWAISLIFIYLQSNRQIQHQTARCA